MIAAVWRVEGASFDVDRFLQTYMLDVNFVWRCGETNRRGVAFATSGFRMSLDCAHEEPSWNDVLDTIRDFFTHDASMITWVQSQGLYQVLAIGMTVGYQPYTQSLLVAPDVLTLLTNSTVNLMVSAYPVQAPDQDD